MAVAAGGTTAVIIAVWVQVTTIASMGDKIKITPQEVVYKFTYKHIVEATYISVSKFEAMLCCASHGGKIYTARSAETSVHL